MTLIVIHLVPLQERIRSIFATPTASDDLVDWCELQFATIQTELDGKSLLFPVHYQYLVYQ